MKLMRPMALMELMGPIRIPYLGENSDIISSKKTNEPIKYPILKASWGVLGRLAVSLRRIDASCGGPGHVLGCLGSVLGAIRWITVLLCHISKSSKL